MYVVTIIAYYKQSNEYYKNVHSGAPTLVLEKQKDFYEAIFNLKVWNSSYFQYDDICIPWNVIYYSIILVSHTQFDTN